MSTSTQFSHIYGLVDPRTDQLRYVGKSKNPVVRKYQHVCASQLRRKQHKNHWIKDLLASGLKPELVQLETVPYADWEEAETFWIAYFRFIGADLTNATAGGGGSPDPSPETRKKIGDACRGKPRKFTEEHIAKIAAANRARASDPVWLSKSRANLVRARAVRNPIAHSWSQESRQKLSASQKTRVLLEPKEVRSTRARLGNSAYREKHEREILCVVCGSAFTAVDVKAMYCSGACNQKAYRARRKTEART